MKSFRTPALLFAALLILSGIAYWDEWQTKKEDEAKKSENKLFDFADADISSVELTYKEGDKEERLVIERKDSSWDITAPVQADAETNEVTNLLKNIREYQYEKKVASDRAQWSQFGLEKPKVKALLKSKDKTHEFYLGDKAQVGYSSYVAKGPDDNNVYIGGQYIDLALSKKLHDYRDKSLAKIDLENLTSFRYERPGQPVVEIVRNNDKWELRKPEPQKLDEEEFRNLVSALNGEKVTTFMDEPSPEMKKAFRANNKATRTVAKISWETKDKKSSSLTFMLNNNELYAAEDPERQILRLQETFKNKIEKDAGTFRYRRIFEFEPGDVAKITIDGKAYEKKDGQWTDLEKSQKADFLNLFLVDLAYAKTERFDLAKGKKMGPPDHRLQLEFSDKKFPPLSVETWKDKKDGTKLSLKVSDKDILYRVNSKVLSNITAEAAQSSAAPELGGEDHDGHDHG